MAFDRLRPLLLALVVAAPASAQTRWDAITHNTVQPVLMEGALLLHDDGTSVRAFSATAQRWTSVSPAGSPVLGTGDWTALLREGSGFRAYSARRNDSAFVSDPSSLMYSKVDDDVALLVFGSAGSASRTAYAYSAVHNQFVPLTYVQTGATVADDIALSRFVIVVRDSDQYWGFSAREGQWVSFTTGSPGSAPQADGNVGLVQVPSVFGPQSLAAFSGVLGVWATSPGLHAAPDVRVDHNVAFAWTASTGGGFRGSAYSAYNGSWITSAIARVGTGAVHTGDNFVLLRDGGWAGNPGFEAIGARPALQWSTYANKSVSLSFPTGLDYFIARELDQPIGIAFSGVCGGGFATTAFTPPSLNLAIGPERVTLGIDSANTVRAYSPATNAFVTGGTVTGAFLWTFGDAVAELIDPEASGTTFTAMSSRRGQLVASPSSAPGTLFTHATGGSFNAHQQTNGNVGAIWIYDERCDRWPAPFDPGGASDMTLGRNVLVAKLQSGDERVWGYSVQRGDWTTPSAAAGAPQVLPAVEENVAHFVDAAGQLWAFGAHGDTHVWYQWPNGTEYQTRGIGVDGGPPSSRLGVSIAGEPGEQALLLAAANAFCPGFPVGGWQGSFCLDIGTTISVGAFAIGASRTATLLATLGTPPAPACVRLWLQGAYFGGTPGLHFGERCDPMEVF